jgi:hypothetical protein
VYVGGVGFDLSFRLLRNEREILDLCARRDVNPAVPLRLHDRLLPPLAGVAVVGARRAAQQTYRGDHVPRDQANPQKPHPVAGRHTEPFAWKVVGLGVDRDELLAAVAHLQRRYARAAPLEHLLSHLAQHRFQKRSVADAEFEHTGRRGGSLSGRRLKATWQHTLPPDFPAPATLVRAVVLAKLCRRASNRVHRVE